MVFARCADTARTAPQAPPEAAEVGAPVGADIEPHPLAATVSLLAEGIKMLRAVDTSNAQLDLWRGMKSLGSTDEFEASGGTETAVMSTTSDPIVAVRYALSEASLMFKLDASSFMNRGADISFLSAFPGVRRPLPRRTSVARRFPSR